MSSERVYLLLGSNEGHRERYLADACAALELALDGRDLRCSAVYETAAWGLEEQPAFLNQAIGMLTPRTPEQVLEAIRVVEAAAERQRTVRWGQRTLDVDILLFGDALRDTPELRIPHPGLPDRRFALMPLAEIAGDVVHPTLQCTIAGLLAACQDPLPVRRVETEYPAGRDAGSK